MYALCVHLGQMMGKEFFVYFQRSAAAAEAQSESGSVAWEAVDLMTESAGRALRHRPFVAFISTALYRTRQPECCNDFLGQNRFRRSIK